MSTWFPEQVWGTSVLARRGRAGLDFVPCGFLDPFTSHPPKTKSGRHAPPALPTARPGAGEGHTWGTHPGQPWAA